MTNKKLNLSSKWTGISSVGINKLNLDCLTSRGAVNLKKTNTVLVKMAETQFQFHRVFPGSEHGPGYADP